MLRKQIVRPGPPPLTVDDVGSPYPLLGGRTLRAVIATGISAGKIGYEAHPTTDTQLRACADHSACE